MIKNTDPSPNRSVYVVKMGEQGSLTIELPQMANQYMLVEHSGNRLVIMPLDQAIGPMEGAIARLDQRWTLLAPLGQEIAKV